MCKSKPDCGCGCKEVYVFEDASKNKDTEYQKFFRKALKKFKVKDPNDFKSDEKKKEFYNWVDDNYKAKNEAYENAIRNLIRRELSAMNESSLEAKAKVYFMQLLVRGEIDELPKNVVQAYTIEKRKGNVSENVVPVAAIRRMVREGLNSTQINEARQNTRFNNWLKKEFDRQTDSFKSGSSDMEWLIMTVLEHTLRDANFHDLQKFLPKIFKGAKQPAPRISNLTGAEYSFDGFSAIFRMFGEDIAAKAKWDGVDILNGFAFVCDIHLSSSHASKVRSLIRRELSLMKEDVHLITESTNRQSVMKWVKGIFKSKVRTTEEFGDGWNGGIWVCGECGDTYTNGKRIYNYYGNSRGYNLGVLQEFESKLNKMGWYSEWYDTGTVFIFPISK